jgi:hypothetical protein
MGAVPPAPVRVSRVSALHASARTRTARQQGSPQTLVKLWSRCIVRCFVTTGMRSWISATSELALVVTTAACAHPFAHAGSFQFSQTGETERRPVLHRGGIRLVCPLSRRPGWLLMLLAMSVASAEAISPRYVSVVDGDTIRAEGRAVRLGFDAAGNRMGAMRERASAR